MKLATMLLAATCLTAGVSNAQNLLYNGDMNIAGTEAPDGWTKWTYSGQNGGGFAAYKTTPDEFSYDSTPYVNVGAWGEWWQSGGGWFQQVPGVAGANYTFSAMSRTELWDSPAAELRLIFLDAGNNVLLQSVQNVANYAQSSTWTSFSLNATAPANTTQVKAEMASWGAIGAIVFDNASLTSVPEPSTIGLLALGAGIALARRRQRG